jgi:hypothetical protein
MLLAPHYFSTSTAEVAYHNSDRKQQQKELTTVVAETHGRRMVATAPVKRTIAVETFMVVEY